MARIRSAAKDWLWARWRSFLATQVFADGELVRLRGFPEIGREELFRFFRLTPADAAFVDPGQPGHGATEGMAEVIGVDAGDQAAVDLDDVRFQLPEVGDRVGVGTRTVNRETNPGPAQRGEDGAEGGGLGVGECLGVLEHHPAQG